MDFHNFILHAVLNDNKVYFFPRFQVMFAHFMCLAQDSIETFLFIRISIIFFIHVFVCLIRSKINLFFIKIKVYVDTKSVFYYKTCDVKYIFILIVKKGLNCETTHVHSFNVIISINVINSIKVKQNNISYEHHLECKSEMDLTYFNLMDIITQIRLFPLV